MRVFKRSLAAWLAVALADAAAVAAQAPQQQGQPSSASAPRDSAQRLNTVTITTSISGRGVARGASAVDAKLLQSVATGTSALNVIQQLPGVNVQAADGLGMYEWST